MTIQSPVEGRVKRIFTKDGLTTGVALEGEEPIFSFTRPDYHTTERVCYCQKCVEPHEKAYAVVEFTTKESNGKTYYNVRSYNEPTEPERSPQDLRYEPEEEQPQRAVFDMAAVRRVTKLAALDRALKINEGQPVEVVLQDAQAIYDWVMNGDA